MWYIDPETGEKDFRLTREEYQAAYANWRQNPKTKALVERLTAERRTYIEGMIARTR